MRKVFLVLPLVAVVCFACNGVERHDAIVTVSERVPDLTNETRGMTTKFYDSQNPYTKEVLAKLAGNPVVQTEIMRFEEAGYTLSPSHSFVTEGDDNIGRHLEIAVLSLGNASDAKNAINLFCIGGGEANVVVPVRLSVDEVISKKEGYEKIADGVWMGVIESSSSRVDSDPELQKSFNWRRWARCVGGGVVAGAIGCAYGCRYAIIAFTQCWSVCTEATALVNILSCTFTELQ